MNKYVWVIDTISRAGKISFEELNRRWTDSEISEGVELSKRTFDNWKNAIQDTFGIFIENEHKGEYRYYIMNEEDLNCGGIRSWLYSTFSVSNTLADSLSLRKRIMLEDVPSGNEHLQTVLEAMKENRILNITYRGYWSSACSCFDVEPFCVRLFRQRWYLVGRCTHLAYSGNAPRIYSLDRIKSAKKTDKTFSMPEDWSAQAFFADCYGIIAGDGTKAEHVRLKVSAAQANYIRGLKLHGSQRETERNDEYSIFTLCLRPTFDFRQELLRNGADIEVLEPLWLRREMAAVIKRMYGKYHADK